MTLVFRACLVGLSLLVLLAGCQSEAGPDTTAVTGTVKHNGTPVAGAAVSFVPVDDPANPLKKGQSAVGVTDSAGKYSLTTLKKDDGAMAGSYKVIVTKFEGAAPAGGGAQAINEAGDMPASYGGAAADAPPAKNLLPAKYEKVETSGLTAEVKAGAANTHDFNLEG
jgi:hypothetical protein